MRKYLIFTVFALILTSCAPEVYLHPISGEDIQAMKKGEPYTPVKDGFFISSFYLKEVMETRVEK